MIDPQLLVDNKYQIIKEIGSGGTGVVYLAYHTTLQKYVVLKKIKQWVMNQDMLRKEADLLKNLHHTYLPQVYDFITVGENVYTVIDYIEGSSLEDLINSGWQPDLQTAKMWFTQLAQVLEYLHNRNPQIIHSDIKPANILITSDNNICLIDFNISLDGSADVSGFSRFYASPEQIQCSYNLINGIQSDLYVDARTDIYSMGATFYHLISGVCPADDAYNTPLTEMFQNDDVFLSIVDRCMAVDPQQRPQTAEQVLRSIRNIYKMTRSYKILNLVRWLSVVLGTMLICGGVIMCVYGSEKKHKDTFKSDYDEVFELYKDAKYEQAAIKGKALINSESSDGYFGSDKNLKPELLHLIASSYYETEDYENAAYYYGLAFDETGKTNGDYYFEYITATIKKGDANGAKQAFADAEKYKLNTLQCDMIRMEFLIQEKNFNELIRLVESKAGDKSYSESARVQELYAQALTRSGSYDKALTACKKAYALDNSDHNLRRLAEAYVDVANKCIREGDGNSAKKNSSEAAKCFEQITSREFCLSSDYINLLHCYQQLDNKSAASALITPMTQKYPTDYKVFAEIAIYYSKISQSDMASQYANKAKQMMPKSDLTDSDRYYQDMMQQLIKQ